MADSRVNYPAHTRERPWIVPLKISAAVSWAIPSSITEFAAATASRLRADLRQAKEARLVANCTVVAATGATLRVQYSLDNGSNWYYLDGVSGPSVAADAVAVAASAWAPIAARDNPEWEDVLLRVVGIGGNGSTAGSYANIVLEVR